MDLPTELRSIIYRAAANDEANSRIIEVTPTLERYPPNSTNDWSFEVAISHPPPKILMVNRETRDELHGRSYMAPFSSQTFLQRTNTSAANLRFNPENDILFLNANCFVGAWMREFLPLLSFFQALFGEKYKKIVLRLTKLAGTAFTPLWDAKEKAHKESLPGLKIFYLINWYEIDIMRQKGCRLLGFRPFPLLPHPKNQTQGEATIPQYDLINVSLYREGSGQIERQDLQSGELIFRHGGLLISKNQVLEILYGMELAEDTQGALRASRASGFCVIQ